MRSNLILPGALLVLVTASCGQQAQQVTDENVQSALQYATAFAANPNAGNPNAANPNGSPTRPGNPNDPNHARPGNPNDPNAQHPGNPNDPNFPQPGNPNAPHPGNPNDPNAQHPGNPNDPNFPQPGNPNDPNASQDPNGGHGPGSGGHHPDHGGGQGPGHGEQGPGEGGQGQGGGHRPPADPNGTAGNPNVTPTNPNSFVLADCAALQEDLQVKVQALVDSKTFVPSNIASNVEEVLATEAWEYYYMAFDSARNAGCLQQ